MKIQSTQNPKLKAAFKLRDRKERDARKLFLVEGFREITRALEKGNFFTQLFYCPSFFLKEGENKIVETLQKKKVECFECTPSVFQKLSYRDRPDGLVAVASFFHKELSEAEEYLSKNPFIVIAESIEKPGNLGTILRSCDAAGVDLFILCDPKTDMYNPNVVRASTGTLFTVPIIPATLTDTWAFLQKHQIKVCSATPKAKSFHTETNLQGPIAIVVGSEQYGLTQHWLDESELSVRIPMMGKADSLNVAQATTLLLYEVLRQRNHAASIYR